jgi:hypothetical protein
VFLVGIGSNFDTSEMWVTVSFEEWNAHMNHGVYVLDMFTDGKFIYW